MYKSREWLLQINLFYTLVYLKHETAIYGVSSSTQEIKNIHT